MNKILKTYTFNLIDENVFTCRGYSLSRAIKHAINEYNIKPTCIKSVMSDYKTVPEVYVKALLIKYAEKTSR